MILALWLAASSAGDRCTYRYTVWDTRASASVEAEPVDKPRSELRPDERGPAGCTPCAEDQRTARLANGLELTACHAVIDDAVAALDAALAAGARIDSVSGYRPVMSRGPVDAEGRRTELSNHAYGAAIDVNREHNGLYEACPRFGPGCRLIHGGPWKPASDPLSLTPDHPVVQQMRTVGLRWGGELEGQQKDFMHFSPTGG